MRWSGTSPRALASNKTSCIALKKRWLSSGSTRFASPILFRRLRRRLLHRFPYGVFYLYDPSLIRVLAILHSSRDPHLMTASGH